MTRASAALIAALLAPATVTTSAPAPLIGIDVVAVDGKGRPVVDLKPAEFEIWINGFQIPVQNVTFVTPREGGPGRTMVLLLDDMVTHVTTLPRLREAAKHFVKRMGPADRMAIVSLDGDSMAATDDRAKLLQRIDKFYVRGVPIRRDEIGAHVLRTVTTISRQLAEASTGRKAVVAIGTAWLFDFPIPPPTVGRDLRPDWVEAMRASAAAHVSLYVVDPAGVGMRPTTGGTSGFARETGGYAFTNMNDAAGAVDRILSELDTYYVLNVENPPVGRKSDLREVDVKVLRKGVTVRARKAIGP